MISFILSQYDSPCPVLWVPVFPPIMVAPLFDVRMKPSEIDVSREWMNQISLFCSGFIFFSSVERYVWADTGIKLQAWKLCVVPCQLHALVGLFFMFGSVPLPSVFCSVCHAFDSLKMPLCFVESLFHKTNSNSVLLFPSSGKGNCSVFWLCLFSISIPVQRYVWPARDLCVRHENCAFYRVRSTRWFASLFSK